jgi:hypothetical protein
MDAQSWWAATSGVQQKLRGGTINLRQDMVEMRDLRDGAPQPSWPLGWPGSNETLTLDVQIEKKGIVTDFSGKYVPVRYSKRQNARLGGGSFVQITMLNMDRGGPQTESLVEVGMPQQKQGEMSLLDDRYFAMIPGGAEIVPIRGKMNPRMPCVTLDFYDFSLNSQGIITDVTMALTHVGDDMRPTNPVAAFGFSLMKAAEGTGHTISHYGWKLNVKTNRAKIERYLRGIAPIPAPTLVPQPRGTLVPIPSGPGSNEALTLKVLRGNNAADFPGSYVPVGYFKVLGPPGGGSKIIVVLLNKERGGPANESMVSAVTPQGWLTFYDPRLFVVRQGDVQPVPKPGAIEPGVPMVYLERTLNSRGRITIEMTLARFQTQMRKSDYVALLRFNEASWQAAESNTGARVSSVDTQFEVEVKSSKDNLRLLR